MRRFLLVLLVSLAPAPLQAQLAYVSGDGTTYNGGSCTACTSDSLNIPSNAAVIVGMRYNRSGSQAITGVASSTGDTYTHAVTANQGTSYIALYYKCGATAGGSTTITYSFDSAVDNWTQVAVWYSGAATTSCADATASGANSGASPITSGSFSTATANQVIVAMAQVNTTGSTWSAGSGIDTMRAQDDFQVLQAADKFVTSTQSGVTAALANTDTSSFKVITVVTIKEAAGGGSGCPRTLSLLGVGCDDLF